MSSYNALYPPNVGAQSAESIPSYRGAHGKQGINSCRYPFTTPGLRETIVDKMPCLGAQALSGTRTRDPLITSREHEPIHYSAST